MKSKWKLLKIKVGARKWKFLQKPVKNYRDGNDMGVAPWFSRTWQDYCSDMPWQVTRDSCPFLSTLAVWLAHPQGRSSLGSERWRERDKQERLLCGHRLCFCSLASRSCGRHGPVAAYLSQSSQGQATSPSPLARSRPFPRLQFIKIEDNAQGFPSPNLPASESIFFSSTPVETDVPDPLLTSSEANCVGLSETLVPTLKTGIMIVPI